jgi:nicotinate-nucleotide adenylyltransferase
VVVPRLDFLPVDLPELEKELPGISERVIIFDKPYVDVNSSEIRQRVAQGISISRLVPAPVEKYIREHGLYGR